NPEIGMNQAGAFVLVWASNVNWRPPSEDPQSPATPTVRDVEDDFSNDFDILAQRYRVKGTPIAPSKWQNINLPTDSNGDGVVTPLDMLVIFNEINLGKGGFLPGDFSGQFRVDVNGDKVLSPLDALIVINQLNARAILPAPTSRAMLATVAN